MSPQLFQARVSQHSLIKGSYHWLSFELVEPHALQFQAGQFLMLNIPNVPIKRAYSIASNPVETNNLDLLIDVGPQGEGTLYLQSLNPGEPVSFLAPMGNFTLVNDPQETRLIMVATGSGISAVRSMILYQLQTLNDPRPIILHWGMRHVEDLFWEEDFRLLEKQFPQFHFDPVLSQAPDTWPLCAGHVTDCLLAHYQDFSRTGFYICGNNHMIDDVSAALTSRGVLPQHLHHERFG